MKRTLNPVIPLALLAALSLIALYMISTDSLPGANATPEARAGADLPAQRTAPRAEPQVNSVSGCTRESTPPYGGGCCGDEAAQEGDPEGSHCK